MEVVNRMKEDISRMEASIKLNKESIIEAEVFILKQKDYIKERRRDIKGCERALSKMYDHLSAAKKRVGASRADMEDPDLPPHTGNP
jgi:hypothetical protein